MKILSKNPLKLGMKVGPHDWYDKLIKSKLSVPACEVYFNFSNFSSYQALFHFLQEKKIIVGLHFSSILSNNIDPNFATDNIKIHQESIKLLKKTIDIAASLQSHYVVYHPGSARVWGIDRKRKVFFTDSVTPYKNAERIFLDTSLGLNNYAKKKRVKLFAETLPGRLLSFEFAELALRSQTFDVGFISFPTILLAGKNGSQICNDICHTMAGIKSNKPYFLQKELLRRTKLLLPYTGLVHLATTKPPFNGADDNGAFLREDYAKGAIPDRNNIEKLLKIFMQKNEIILIPEPKLDPNIHIKNYKTLSQIITNLSLNDKMMATTK